MKTFLFVIISGLIVFLSACKQEQKSSTNKATDLKKVTIGLQNNCAVSMLLVAKAKGYFTEQGLDVNFNFYPSGKLAYNAMLEGDVNYATVADMPIASHGVNVDAKILATFSTTRKGAWIIARTDKGIKKPENLSGKTIGTQKNSAVHYFLVKFIEENHLENCKIEFMPAKELPQALADGKIDAFSMRNPFIKQAEEMLPGKTVEFFSNIYMKHIMLTEKTSWAKKNLGVSLKIVKALLQAEKFINKNKEQASALVAESLPGNRLKEVKEDWGNYDNKIGLSQNVVLILENQAALLREDPNADIPNFLQIVDQEPLQQAAPSKITLVGADEHKK